MERLDGGIGEAGQITGDRAIRVEDTRLRVSSGKSPVVGPDPQRPVTSEKEFSDPVARESRSLRRVCVKRLRLPGFQADPIEPLVRGPYPQPPFPVWDDGPEPVRGEVGAKHEGLASCVVLVDAPARGREPERVLIPLDDSQHPRCS